MTEEIIDLDDIRQVRLSELSSSRLNQLKDGYHSLQDILDNPSITGDGIILDGRDSGPPYEITDGRHRIFLAREEGERSIKATLRR
jgi:hypothetical protein